MSGVSPIDSKSKTSLESASHNGCSPASERGQASYVIRVAGEDPISAFRHQHDRRVDRVASSGSPDEHARLTTELFINGADINRAQQTGQWRLASPGGPPHLSEDDSTCAQPNPVLLSYPEPG